MKKNQDPKSDEDENRNYIILFESLKKNHFDIHPSVSVQTDDLIRYETAWR